LWLAERQGRIRFGVDIQDRIKGMIPPAPVVQVEAMSVTEEEVEQKSEAETRYGQARIVAGNVVGALLAAISSARGNDPDADAMVDEGDSEMG